MNYSLNKRKKSKYSRFYFAGTLSLLIFLLLAAVIGQKTREFDFLVESAIERLQTQLAAEKYDDVFLQSSRQLIISYDQQEFERMLRTARPQLIEPVRKNCTTKYADMTERLKRLLHRSFRLETDCRIRNEFAENRCYFGWRVGRNGEIKLLWFEVAP